MEHDDVVTLDEATALGTEDYRSDNDIPEYAGSKEGDQEFPDLADENDNLLLDEAGIPGIDEYLSFLFNDNNQNANEEETPLYVNGKSVVRGSDTNRRFICSLCDKAFALKQHLEYHMVIHTGDKPFICGICRKPFAHRHHLTQHMLTHADKSTVPMHRCTICGCAFLQSYNLTRHLRLHTGERRFPCFICNKFFTNKWSLQNHLMIHTDDRPFTCEICSRGFRKKCHLQRHLRTHVSNKRKRRKCSKACHQHSIKRRNRTHDMVTRGKGSLSDASIRQNGKIVCINCDESFPSQMKFKNHDCAYVAPRYCARQMQKRKETITIEDSESDEDIHDVDDVDEDYIVSDDDSDTDDNGGEEEDSEDYEEDCEDDDDDDYDDDDDDDDDEEGHENEESCDDDVIIVDDGDNDDDDDGGDDNNDDGGGEEDSGSEISVNEYGVEDFDNDENDDAVGENSADEDGDDYDDFADEINNTSENRAVSLKIKIE